MLCGIGGKTIAEAKRNLSYSEVMEWSEYRNKRGTFNLGRRIEVGSALIAMTINRAHGGKSKLSDFTPHESEDGETTEGSINDVMKILKAVPSTKRKRFTPKEKKK